MSVAVAHRPDRSRTAPQMAVRQMPLTRYDRAWMAVMRATDLLLRRVYGVQSFNDDPNCLLRIARGTASHDVLLSDGVAVHAGDPIIALHFWNERMPRFGPSGPDFAWARLFRHRVLFSLHALACHLKKNDEWDDARAIFGCVTFGSRARRWQIRLAAARFGFELVPGEPPNGLHQRGEDILIWGFVRAFNPAALHRHSLWRDRTELWISRARLLRRCE